MCLRHTADNNCASQDFGLQLQLQQRLRPINVVLLFTRPNYRTVSS